MPFPWKKVKNTKISQLVSDHLESQRRQGGHLVVETGFPTSLVDLFVKNRDRLKKPKPFKKKKKTQNIDNSSPLPWSSPFPLPQGPSPSPLTSPSISPTPSSLSLDLSTAASSSLAASDNGVQEAEADGVDEEINKRPNAKGVVGAILRMFFVVVLALGAKKFAVGLTMSAFLLFLLEYVGKHSYRLLVPCSEAKRRLRFMIQRIFQVISFRDKDLDEDNSSITEIKGQREANFDFNKRGGCMPIFEIQIDRRMFVEDIQGVRKEIGESSSDRRMEFQFEKESGQVSSDGKSHFERSDSKMMQIEDKEAEYRCDISESKKENSKRARMKLKMKHLVPRKLRRSKKEKRDLERETCPSKEEIIAVLEEPEENERGDARNLEGDDKLCLLLSRKHEGNDQISMICSSDGVGEENVEEIVIREEQEKRRKGNSGYLILCLIVLAGLVGGRVIALMLMVLWFLMLKSGEKLRRYIKLPVIRSLTEKSS